MRGGGCPLTWPFSLDLDVVHCPHLIDGGIQHGNVRTTTSTAKRSR